MYDHRHFTKQFQNIQCLHDFFFLNLDRLEFAMHNYDFFYHTCKCNLSFMKHI